MAQLKQQYIKIEVPWRLLILSAIQFISSCSQYSLSINENLLYKPPGLFDQFNISDARLSSCIKTTIANLALTHAEQLTKLMCPPGNIVSLEGIQTFSSITQLGLADNQIVSLEPLSALPHLTHLNVLGNKITNIGPLKKAQKIKFINLEKNLELDCRSLKALLKHPDIQIKPPKHCIG